MELIEGTVVSVTFPDREHGDIQHRLYDLFREQLGVTGRRSLVVRLEYGYALGTQSRFRAGVAVIDFERHRTSAKRLAGAPELVAEVMSRSNTEAKIDNLRARCFEKGCLSFWRIYPKKQQVMCARLESGSVLTTAFGLNDIIPFQGFGIRLNDIFDA